MYKKHFGFHYSENDISHHGILGQKWGIRRYQNPDGSLTPEGRLRYGYGNAVLKSAAEQQLTKKK